MLRILALAVLAVSLSTSAHAGKCSMSKAGGIGLTNDIAKFMSNKALHNMIEKNGEKGVGKVVTTCDSTGLNCVSSQRTCTK